MEKGIPERTELNKRIKKHYKKRRKKRQFRLYKDHNRKQQLHEAKGKYFN